MDAGKRKDNNWKFTIYVAGNTERSASIIARLKEICNLYIGDAYDIQVVDMLEHPELARQHQILAAPTVIRTHPVPERRVIGDLSHISLVVNGLELPLKALERPKVEQSLPGNP